MTTRQLPGVVTRKSHRSNPQQHAIDMLRAAGADTAWYYKGAQRQPVEQQAVAKCSRFATYILDGDYAYTLASVASTNPGDKYKEYRRLKEPVNIPCYYCASCKGRWLTYEEAMAHLEGES